MYPQVQSQHNTEANGGCGINEQKTLRVALSSPAACFNSVCELCAGMPVDLVVACDCVYPDPDGPSPDAAHFVAALAALCAPSGAQGRCEPKGSQWSCQGSKADTATARRGVQHAEQPSAPRGAGACAEARPAAATLVAQSAAPCTSTGATGDCRESGGCAPPVSGEAASEPEIAAAVPISREGTGGSAGAAAEPLLGIAAMRCSAGSATAESNGHGAGVSGRALVTFEARSDEMRVAFLQAARARFGSVRRLPAEELPSRYCVQHVEVYELASCKQWQA